MIELVNDIVLQQFTTAGSVYSVLEERVSHALRNFRWNNPSQLQEQVQSAFPFYPVKATMEEVYVIRFGRKPESNVYKFYL